MQLEANWQKLQSFSLQTNGNLSVYAYICLFRVLSKSNSQKTSTKKYPSKQCVQLIILPLNLIMESFSIQTLISWLLVLIVLLL